MPDHSLKRIQILSYLNFIVLGAILIYGYSYLFLGAYYSHPNAEDFSLTANAKNYSILYSIKDVLVNYDGRYFTNFLHTINPLAFGCISCYKWINTFSLLFPIFSLYFFFRSINPKSNKLHLLAGSALFALVNYAMSPSLVHQVYWMASSFVYHYSWCFYLLWLGSFIRSMQSPNSKKTQFAWFLASSILLVCSMGMNELFLIINTLSLLGIYLYLRLNPLKNSSLFWPFLTTGVLSILFFISNPGISNRINSFESQKEALGTLTIITRGLIDFWQEIVCFVAYLPFLLPLTILFALYFFANFKSDSKLKIYHLAIPFIALQLSVFAFYIPMGFERGIPNRIYTTIYFGLLLFSTLGVPFYYKNKIQKFIALKDAKFKSLLKLCCFVVLSLSLLLINNNITLLKKDYHSGKMEKLDALCKSRYAIIQAAANNDLNCWKRAVIPTLSNTPNSIYHQPDIKPNRGEAYWNQAYEKYFLVNEVSLEEDTISLLQKLQKQVAR